MTTRIEPMRRFTMRIVDPVLRHVAGYLPGFAVLTVTGRTSGRRYDIPMNVFRDHERYVFALTYGPDVQWVRNVLATGSCTMRTRGRRVTLVDPERLTDPTRRLMPQPVRWFLGRLRVTEFLRMRPIEA